MTKVLRTAATTMMLTISIAAAPNVLAASACKGLSESACDKSKSCYWISSYKRSDGRKVSAHCRTKPSSSIKNSAKSTKQKASDKAANKTKSVTDKAKTSSAKATKKAADKSANAKKKALKTTEKKS